MIPTTAFIVALIVSYAATPQDAAKLAVYAAKGSHVQIERTNVTGRYATVLMRNAMMEGSLDNVPILLERFSFGWQPLESVDSRCRLDVHAISAHDKDALMRGMPKPEDERACTDDGSRDFGPVAQVEALRKRSQGPLLPSVVVAGAYALVQWYGGGGGQRLYQHEAGQWRLLTGGGGAIGSAQLAAFGVPRADWCRLGIYDAKCPGKR